MRGIFSFYLFTLIPFIMSVSYSLSQNELLPRPDNSHIIDNSGTGSSVGSSGTLVNSKPNPNPIPDEGTVDNSSTVDTRTGGDAIDFNPDGWYDEHQWDKNGLIEFLMRFGLSQERAEYEAQRIANNLVYTGNDVPIFTPDPNASPSDNLANLSAWLSHAIGAYEVNNDLGFDKSFNFANQLIRVYSSLCNSGNGFIEDLSDGATLELAEKITDNLFSFINTQFSAAMSYQSWYLQQEYNSPVNQMDRLAKAGLSSAFVVGNSLGSGNASSPASMSPITQPANSGAGNAEVQAQANKQSFIGQLLSNGISLVSMGLSGYKTLLEGDAIKKLTPLQLAKAGSDILGSAATYERLLTENSQVKQSMEFQKQQLALQAGQSELTAQNEVVGQSLAAVDSFFNRHKKEFREVGWSTHVVDKSGNTVRKVYNLDGMKYINEHNGQDMEGNQVVDSKYYKRHHDVGTKGSTSFGIPGIGDVDAEFNYGFSFESQNAHSDTSTNSKTKGYSNSSQNTHDHSDGTDTSNTWRIGDTEFHQEINTRYLLDDEYKAEYERLQGVYDNALKTYNSMTEKHKSNMLLMKSCLDWDFGQQSASNVMHSFRNLVHKYLPKDKNSEKPLIGD